MRGQVSPSKRSAIVSNAPWASRALITAFVRAGAEGRLDGSKIEIAEPTKSVLSASVRELI